MASTLTCKSGKHVWLDAGNRCRCCNGYVRVGSVCRQELEQAKAENIHRLELFGEWKGWVKEPGRK